MGGAETADLGALAAVLMMAVATGVIRMGGFWLMGRVPLTPRVRRMFDALPGSIVAAIVAPVVIKTGLAAALGIAAAIWLMTLRRNEFLAIFGGLGVVAAARAAGL